MVAQYTNTSAPLLPESASEPGTRTEILRAGLALFAERGFHAASIREVAVRAGIKSASLYAHFASKEAILAELVLVGHDVHHRLLTSALLESGPDPRDQLEALVRAHVASHARYDMLARVANEEMVRLSPVLAAPALALRRRTEELLAEVVERGERSGVFDLITPAITRSAIAALGRSVASWYPVRGAEFGLDAVADAHVALVFRMVGAQR